MITKKAVEAAQKSGEYRAMAHYGLQKLAGPPMGVLGTLAQGASRFEKAFSASKRGILGGLQTGYRAMGAPAQNVLKAGLGAGVGAYALGNMSGQNDMMRQEMRRGPYGY